jgi:hypothetical protein
MLDKLFGYIYTMAIYSHLRLHLQLENCHLQLENCPINALAICKVLAGTVPDFG